MAKNALYHSCQQESRPRVYDSRTPSAQEDAAEQVEAGVYIYNTRFTKRFHLAVDINPQIEWPGEYRPRVFQRNNHPAT
jgi:hypothetical protein